MSQAAHAGEACKQESHLRIINQRWIDLDKKMDRMVEALEALAAQRVEIEHLIEQQRDTKSWLKRHEERIQALERAPGGMASRFLWIVVGAVVTIGAGIATGLGLIWIQR